MANRESYPASLFPLRGDVSAEAGATSVIVQGLQTVPISTQLPNGSAAVGVAPALVALGGTNITQATWTPVPLDNSLLVESVPMSDDYEFLINNAGMEVLVNWSFGFASQVFVEGTPAP